MAPLIPVVTGLSPNEGPPGTKVTIRGEHFGNQANDLIGLKICGCDCLLSAEWKTPNKIIAITGPIKGKGDVVVTTRLGGQGTCSVTFKGYYETIGPMKETAVWIEEAPLFTWGRNALSPISYQQEDPLGLSTEGNEKKFPEDDLLEYFPDCGGDITADNFSPGWFLLVNHHGTSFSDLRAGLTHLRRKVEGQKEGQLSFLKANVSSVMDQLDTIVILKEKYENDTGVSGTEPTLNLEKAIKESEREARKLFDDVLARRDKAEQRQNALNVLNRFRLLFCLPCVIEQNVKKGDFEIVINDYLRVKNLFSKTEVPIFKTALDEIEKRIADLKRMLQTKLITMPITVDEQKRLIKYLITLEADYDPAWDAIYHHYEYIGARMQRCYEEHKKCEEALLDEFGKSKDSASKYSKYNAFPQDVNVVPENILFTEELCEVMSLLFPDLWRIGQAYFTEELHVKVGPGRQSDFKKLIVNVVRLFVRRVYAAIIPHLLEQSIGSNKEEYGVWSITDSDDMVKHWLPACLRRVRATYSSLIRLEIGVEPLDMIQSLILDLRVHCMAVLFQRTREHVTTLGNEEVWRVDFVTVAGNAAGRIGPAGDINGFIGITQFPIEFERAIQDVIQIVRDSVFTSEQREPSLLQNAKATKELDRQIEALLLSAHSVLLSLSQKRDQDDNDDCSGGVVSQLLGTPTNIYRKHSSHSNIPLYEHRLLTTLSNCRYTRTVILFNLETLFRSSIRPISATGSASGDVVDGRAPFAVCRKQMEQLERSILEQYLEEKCDPLVGTIEPSMYLDRFDWDTNITPTDIRPYAKECINNLIQVQSEVNSISPALIRSVLPQVVQTISEELYRLMSCVQCTFSTFGVQQARIDIAALQMCFKSYLTPTAQSFFKEALDALPTIPNADMLLVEDILKSSFERMRLQTLCLS